MSDCEHCCCAQRDSSDHRHASSPEDCGACALARHAAFTELAEPFTPPLGSVVVSVMERIVPAIAGLPAGDELRELVEDTSRRAYVAGLSDPDLLGLDSDSWRTVVATRVGMTLAFPHL
jgi:hypothetical protein